MFPRTANVHVTVMIKVLTFNWHSFAAGESYKNVLVSQVNRNWVYYRSTDNLKKDRKRVLTGDILIAEKKI